MAAGELDSSGTQWYPYLEWSFPNSSYSGNPYDLTATVTFLHGASGEARTTEMFYDGSDTWKTRFTATLTGTWTASSSSSDPDLNGLTGTIDVSANPDPNARGFLTSSGEKYVWQGSNEAFAPVVVMYAHPELYWDFGANQPNTQKIQDDVNTFIISPPPPNGRSTHVAWP